MVELLSGGLKPEAVIFDFDGVIVDTEPLHYRAFQEVLVPLGFAFSWEEYVATYMGFDDRDAFDEAFKNNGKTLTDSILRELIQQKAVCFIKIISNGITAYPGVLGLIREVHTREIPLAISSGALRSDIEPILELLDITECFDVIVTADDVSKSKPDPECYCLAHQKLQSFWNRTISANRVLAIEDTPAGIAAAKGAGLQVIGVTNSYPKERLHQADWVVSTLQL